MQNTLKPFYNWIHLITYAIFFLFIVQCSNNKSTSQNQDSEYYQNIINDLEYQSVIKSDSHVKVNHGLTHIQSIGSLDRSSQYILGEIKKVIIYEENVFLLDSRSKQLKVYNLITGEHLKTSELRGRGPGEVLFPEDMLFDETGYRIFILDAQGKFLEYDLIGEVHPEINQERNFRLHLQNMCMNENDFVFRVRLSADYRVSEIQGKIVLFNESEKARWKAIGEIYDSDNWLLTSQLSRGVIFCSQDDSNIYTAERYLPIISIYKAPEYDRAEHLLMEGLDLIRIISSFAARGLPEISYDHSHGGAVINNIIASKTDLFIQTYELLRNGDENIHTYRINKNDHTLKNVYSDLGFIHQITDSLIVTSVNTPYPKVEIYRWETE